MAAFDNVSLASPPNGPAWLQAAAQMMNTVGNQVGSLGQAYQQGQDWRYQQNQRNFFQDQNNQATLQQALQSVNYAPLMQALIQQGGTGTALQLLPALIQSGASRSADQLAWGQPGQQQSVNTGPANNSSASGPANIQTNYRTQLQAKIPYATPSSLGTDNEGGQSIDQLAAERHIDLHDFLSAYPGFQRLVGNDALTPGQVQQITKRMATFADAGNANPISQSGQGDQEGQNAAASNQLRPSMGEGSSAMSPRQTAGQGRVAQAAPPGPIAGDTFNDRFSPTNYKVPSDDDINRYETSGNNKLRAAGTYGLSKEKAEALRDAGNKDLEIAKQLREERKSALGPTEKQKDISSGATKETLQAGEDAKYYNSLHRGLTGTAMIAAQQKQNIDMLRQVASSPNFIPGAGSGLALAYQRAIAQLGINPTAAAPREIFNQVATRILADQISGLKSMASETGEQGARVFKSMIDLEEKANITHENSLEGIKSQLDIIDRVGDLMLKWANKADDYKLRHGSLDAGFDKELRADIAKARLPNIVPQGAQPSVAPKSQPGGWQEIAPGIRIREKPSAANQT